MDVGAIALRLELGDLAGAAAVWLERMRRCMEPRLLHRDRRDVLAESSASAGEAASSSVLGRQPASQTRPDDHVAAAEVAIAEHEVGPTNQAMCCE